MAIDHITHIGRDNYIVIQLPNDLFKIYHTGTEVIHLGKYGSFYSKDIIGYPYGTVFDIEYDEKNDKTDVVLNHNFTKKSKKEQQHQPGVIKPRLNDTAQTLEVTEDILLESFNSESNKLLIDKGSEAQKLKTSDIELLKQNNVNTSKIIKNIITNHENFNFKTKQSQEKYLVRKFKKFSKCFKVERCSPQNILKFLMDKNDMIRINDISLESMGLQLNLSNIQSNGNYLLMDETGGFLIYSVLERMYGGREDDETKNGTITVITETEHPQLDLLKYSNYSDEFLKKTVKYLSVMEFLKPQNEKEIAAEFKLLNQNLDINDLKKIEKDKITPLQQRKLNWYNKQLQIYQISQNFNHYDAFVVQTDFELKDCIQRFHKFIKPGCPIVVFCKFREPLLDLSNEYLMKSNNYLNVKIMQTYCRPYQTKRGKIHPVMTMKSNGGWLLSCYRVLGIDL
ncbi:unnamed protein product [Hanseniaspora opuntiae]